MVFVPIAHDLVHAATVHTARQAAHFLDEVTKERGTWRKFLVVDIAVQGLVHSEDDLRHVAKSPSQVLQNSLGRHYAEPRLGTKLRAASCVTDNQRSANHPLPPRAHVSATGTSRTSGNVRL